MARTNKDRRAYICTTPQPNVLNQAAFEALAWVEIGNVGAIGESGTQTNVVSYDELATDVTQKGKGISNAGDPTIECARNPTDPGQVALRAAAKTNFNYAFKFEDKDAPDADHTNSIYYNRGLVTGPTRPNGRNEDFILEVFTLALNQREIVVDPVATVAPTNTLLPAIAGIAQVGQVLTALPGEWTGEPFFAYQWKLSGSDIPGATGKTYTPVVGDIGSDLAVAVTASNPAGNVTKTSGATADVIAA
ncbi:hypothetical protein GCM10011321_14630 [Youhaiella tibetensis]|uniref:hypothetical protein n=1 Tax=Paradevosia tibetensis TaxID=1447062 RepID=UPI0019A70CFE|nr:hypothetical protein [Youhaiella tibetensis]GGF24329.1 hypothetical protein GCM10011321_14630 [Youhaiella tibetensis]